MKLLNIADVGTSYPSYLPNLYARHPALAARSYEEQYKGIGYDHFMWPMPFNQSMGAFGYRTWNIDRSAESLQRAWALENGHVDRSASSDDVIVAQARVFRPDVLFYEIGDARLLRRLRDEVRSIRLVLGWVGSSLTLGRAWRDIDLLITCAPESVSRLKALGVRARHVPHSFDPRVIERLHPTRNPILASFIGSIVRRKGFHIARERTLLRLNDTAPLSIFSPTVEVRPSDYLRVVAGAAAFGAVSALRGVGLFGPLRSFGVVARAERVASPPRLPVNKRLAKNAKPGVYGLEYFQVLKDSAISINIHADTSPEFASNMRLYEATGTGSCLLTDWKANLAELFDPDREVVVYRSDEEAAEKLLWLINNPKERAEIAAAGQRRTLRDHTSTLRASLIDEIIREEIAGQPFRSRVGTAVAANRVES